LQWLKKIAAKNGPVLKCPVPAENDYFNAGHVWYSDFHCSDLFRAVPKILISNLSNGMAQ
jgi:hypothetical protein